MNSYYTYILSNFARTVFYIGVTNNIQIRLLQHRDGQGSAFTSKYRCHYLMYFETFTDINQAIAREKNLKNWHREWKTNLIRKENPDLLDLAADWYD
jgi:putative endonuclease